MRDGRLEPLLNLPKQEAAFRKYTNAVKEKVKHAPQATDQYVRAKARSIVNNNRYLWRIGRWTTNTKTDFCNWRDPEGIHPYSAFMAEGEGTLACPSRKNKDKKAMLEKLENFQECDLPEHKAECLQGDARERLGTWLRKTIHAYNILQSPSIHL